MLDNANSYCERCGTRYVFNTSAPKTLSLKGARLLAKGLKNFVLNDGQSMNDAMALARTEDEREDTSRMTEAFHRTFNFCMTCRQYACDKCWNARQGACLTCAPEPGLGPVAPEDHLIVRTPVARGDNDWALFPDIPGSDGEPAADAPPTLSAWPAQDLRVPTPDASAGGSGMRGHDQPVRDPADREAWSLWPIADEIAPEMTLTPGEMVIVEAQLAQDEPAGEATPVHDAIPPQALPDVPEIEAWVLRSNLAGEPSQPSEPLRPVARERPDQATGPDAAPTEELGVPLGNADMAPPPPPTPSRGQRPAVVRLLGRFAPRRDGSPSSVGPEQASRRGHPDGDPWPHATAWSHRPIQAHDWSTDAEPVVTQPEAVPIDATFSATSVAPQSPEPEAELEARMAELSHEFAGAPGPVADEAPATPPAAPIPFQEPVPVAANQQTLFDVAPATDDLAGEHGPESVAWSDADSEAAQALRKLAPPHPAKAPRPVDTSPPSRGPQAPAPWPPLGASWPAQETPGAPWPGPDTPSVPAAVVAREAALPVLAGIWAQSAQEVLNRGSVRVCHHCALPVSTQARYCRRCGTKQA